VRGVQQVLFALHTAVAGHLQSTEPQSLLTVVPHAPLHFGSAQHVPLSASQACPDPHLQVRLPQSFIKVTPHFPSQRGSSQHVPAMPLVFEVQALPEAHAHLSVEPQPSGRSVPH
jgi:hypothetical protein